MFLGVLQYVWSHCGGSLQSRKRINPDTVSEESSHFQILPE